MKQFAVATVLFISLTIGVNGNLKAQSQEFQQLLLDIEKLNQLRAILDNMYKGYEILQQGYTTVKNLAEGNFDLHKTFLDGLLDVSPTVKQYKRIAEIISIQQKIIKESKDASVKFGRVNIFSSSDLNYIHSVYSNLIDRSLKNLDELIMVITSGSLRMNDAERIQSIDKIYNDILDKLSFLRHFNSQTTILAAQRTKQLNDINQLYQLYGIKN